MWCDLLRGVLHRHDGGDKSPPHPVQIVPQVCDPEHRLGRGVLWQEQRPGVFRSSGLSVKDKVLRVRDVLPCRGECVTRVGVTHSITLMQGRPLIWLWLMNKAKHSAGSPGHTCACDMYLLTFSFLLPYFNHSCIYIFHLCPELWVIVRSWCLWDLLYIGGFNDQHYVWRDCLLLVVAPDCFIFIIMCHDGYFRLRFWTVTDGNRLFFWHDGVYGNLHYFVGKNI